MKKSFLTTLFMLQLIASPKGAEIVSGAVQIDKQGNLTQIHAADRSIIHWEDFSIKLGETTLFIQPGCTSSVLNRVVGITPSMIEGVLEANGRVILINPNGIMIGKEAVIHAADFIAATSEVVDLADWSIRTERNGAVHLQNGAINHEGRLHAMGIESVGGKVLLVANSLNVKGSIEAPQGTVELYGKNVTLDENALVDVSGDTRGGSIFVGDDLPGTTTSIGPSVHLHADAKSRGDGGRVILWGKEDIQFHGTVTARGGEYSGDGGFVEVSSLGGMAFKGFVDTKSPLGKPGMLLIDPTNVIISAAADFDVTPGPVYTYTGAAVNIDAAALSLILGGSSVLIDTTSPVDQGQVGTIMVLSPILWGSATSLTLSASSTVTVSASIQCSAFLPSGSIAINSVGGDVNIVPAGGVVDISSALGPVSITAARDVTFRTIAAAESATIGFGGMGTGSVDIIAGRDVILDNPIPGTVGILTLGLFLSPAPINIDAGRHVIIGNNSAVVSDNGPVLIKADQNIEMQAGSSIFYTTFGMGLAPSPITLVVDDQAPTAPQIGSGAFIMDATANIGNPVRRVPIQIFTARRVQNSISGSFYGVNFFAPGPYNVNTATERWGVYWPNPFLNFPSPSFTIFYKEPQPEMFAIIEQTIGQAFLVIEEFAYPSPSYEDFFCITECARAVGNREERRECPYIHIENYRKFYPDREKDFYPAHVEDPIFDTSCAELEE